MINKFTRKNLTIFAAFILGFCLSPLVFKFQCSDVIFKLDLVNLAITATGTIVASALALYIGSTIQTSINQTTRYGDIVSNNALEVWNKFMKVSQVLEYSSNLKVSSTTSLLDELETNLYGLQQMSNSSNNELPEIKSAISTISDQITKIATIVDTDSEGGIFSVRHQDDNRLLSCISTIHSNFAILCKGSNF